MATITIARDFPVGQTEHLYVGTIDFDSSYPTGGEALDTTKNERFDFLFAGSKGGYVFSWDATNQKLLAYVSKDPGNAGGADIVLQQVANTTDLSALTGVQFWAVGA